MDKLQLWLKSANWIFHISPTSSELNIIVYAFPLFDPALSAYTLDSSKHGQPVCDLQWIRCFLSFQKDVLTQVWWVMLAPWKSNNNDDIIIDKSSNNNNNNNINVCGIIILSL